MKLIMPILLPPPSPYEYALISEASYSDVEPKDSILSKKGWKRIKSIADAGGYCGSIWVHETNNQIVIAHRGSQNATSWVTDLQSIAQLKPGHFVTAAVQLLSDPIVQDYKSKGYRLSTTGHSLGGFLAQVCVFWAQRSEFNETYYSDMSAVVFDSPGAVDFLRVIQSNLVSQKNRIEIEKLNIHNFCPMPTIVSTYGTKTGTVWHLSGSENVSFAFVEAHRMDPILEGFDPETGQPIHYRQMRDWPQADYSNYNSISNYFKHAASTTVHFPLDCLNHLYKQIKTWAGYAPTDTWYDQVLRQQEGQVTSFLRQTAASGYRPDDNQDLEKVLTQAFQSHYIALSDAMSQKQMSFYHFDKETQEFLKEVMQFKQFPLKECQTYLEQQYESEINELKAFELKQDGQHLDIVLSPDYPETIFDFQTIIQHTLQDKEKLSLQKFLVVKAESFQNRLVQLEQTIINQSGPIARRNQGEIEALREKLVKIEEAQSTMQNTSRSDNTFNVRTAIANVPGTMAINELNERAYEPARHQELLDLVRTARPGQQYNIDCSLANADRSTAIVTSSSGVSEGTANLLVRLGALNQKHSAPQTNAPAPQNETQKGNDSVKK